MEKNLKTGRRGFLEFSGTGVAGLAVGGAAGYSATSTSLEQNKAIFRRMIEGVWNKDNLAVVDELIAPNYVRHCQASAKEYRGPDEYKRFHQETKTTFPDYQETINFIVAEGDKIAVYSTARGTQRGSMGPFPATGKQMTLEILAIHRLEGGKIVETWVTWDNMAILAQLGHLPPPG